MSIYPRSPLFLVTCPFCLRALCGSVANLPSMIERAAANILDHFLCPPPGREVAVVYPPEKAAVAEALARGLAERRSPPLLLPVPAEAPALPEPVLAAFARSNAGLIVLLSHRLWARQGLAPLFVMRAGQPGLDVHCSPLFVDTIIAGDSFLRVYSSDPTADRGYLARLSETLPAQARVRITAPGGTDLTFRSRGWQVCANTEVLTAPVEGSADGTIVADASLFLGLVASPVTVRIRAGRVTEMAAADPADRLFRMYAAEMERRFAESEADAMLAEVGVGGNGGAVLSGVLMEDEAVRGTCHFCFGDNSRYGGENGSDWHGGTLVVREPFFYAT